MESRTTEDTAGEAGGRGTASAADRALGLRERKKLETRKRLAKAALELSERNGFEATTVSAIAAAADVSPRTVFGYFPTKESIVFGGTEEFLDSLEAHLRERAPGKTVADALRDWLLSVLDDRDEKEAELVDRRRALIDAEPSLRAYERMLLERGEQMIARAAATDIGGEPTDLLPQMVGAATIAALESITRSLKEGSGDAPAVISRHIDDLTGFIGGGIAAIAPAPGP